MTTLTEKTLIPLGMAIAVIGGAAVWLSSLNWQAASAKDRIMEVERRMSAVEAKQEQMLQSLSRIEGYLRSDRRNER